MTNYTRYSGEPKILIEIDTDTQRVVPVEPTDKMLRVANEKVLGSGLWREGYKAMVAAAPQPEPVDDLRWALMNGWIGS